MNWIDWLKNRYVQTVAAFVIGGFAGVAFYPTKTIEERVYEETKEHYESVLEETKKTHSEESSKLQEQLTQSEQSSKEFKEEVSRNISSLKTENSELRQSQKRRKFKLIKPDGTIIEKEYEESQSSEVTSVVTEVREEFNRKVSSIENKWKTIHQERVKELKKQFEEELAKKETQIIEKEKIVEKEKITTINEKKFRVESGVTTDKTLYVYSSYPLWGPFTVGGGFSAGGSTSNIDFGEARVGVGISF